LIRTEASIVIACAPQQTFDFVVLGFARNYPRWSPEVQSIELLTPGPLRIGSRARQIRVDQGRRSDTTFSVVALEPPRRVVFAETSGQFRIAYQIAPAQDRAQITFVFELIRLELYMRPFEKLIRLAVQEGAERVVRNIKLLIEREPLRPSSPQT
jgi:hypothetical protein